MTVILTSDPLGWSVDGPTAVAIGVFDGVHLGHRAVLTRLVERARASGLVAVALTFDPHPLEFLAPDRAPDVLTTVGDRAELMGECGIEVVGVLPFLQIRDLAPVTFAVEVLANRLRAAVVAVGEDFRFGRGRVGDVDLLRRLGRERGFEVEGVDLIGEWEGRKVSSSLVRQLVTAGDVETAAELLGRHHGLVGTVIHGDARGRLIGFPTANIHIPERMAVPGNGVYAGRAEVDGSTWEAVINVGVRPTFAGADRTVEAHLLDFDRELYGRQLRVSFVTKLRDEQRFESVDALVAQIGRDVEAGRRRLAQEP